MHTCPHCHLKFELPASRLVPEQAPWWKPQVACFLCPHCAVILNWQPNPPYQRALHWRLAGSVCALMVVIIFVDGGNAWYAGAVYFGLILTRSSFSWPFALRHEAAGAGRLTSGRQVALMRQLACGSFVLDAPSALWPRWLSIVLGVMMGAGLAPWAQKWLSANPALPIHPDGVQAALCVVMGICYWRAFALTRQASG